MKFKNIFKNIIIHPLFFALYPFLFLLSHNTDEIYVSEIVMPFGIAFDIAVLLFLIIYFFSRNIRKTGFFVSLLLLLFFSYGHIREIILSIRIHHIRFYGDWYLLSIWCIIFISSIFLIIRSKSDFYNGTMILNFISIALIIIVLISLIGTDPQWNSGFAFSDSGLSKENKAKLNSLQKAEQISNSQSSSKLNEGQDLPDIYYIILDGYAGEETLKNTYNFDNSKFLNFLRNKGFFVVSKAKSNYAHTPLSIASSLNMTYINEFISKKNSPQKNNRILYNMTQNNKVINFLKKQNYITIHLCSRAALTSNNPYCDLDIDLGKINDFILILVRTTLLAPFTEKIGFYNMFRVRILNNFKTFPEIAKIKKPTFTFCHFMVPHPPYLFKKNGMPNKISINKMIGFHWKDRMLYIEQLQYVSYLAREMINKIILNSKKTPIIVLQADHGTASLLEDSGKDNWKEPTKEMLKERFSILNAFILPGLDRHEIPITITPVNTFRMIFTKYFNRDIAFLEDKYFFSHINHPYILTDVTKKLNTD